VYSGASSVLVFPSPKSHSAEIMPRASRTLNWMVSSAVPDICCWEVVTGISGVSAAVVVVAVAVSGALVGVATGVIVSPPQVLRPRVMIATTASKRLDPGVSFRFFRAVRIGGSSIGTYNSESGDSCMECAWTATGTLRFI